MSAVHSGIWHQMLFVSPEGREEALWVEQQGPNTYRVLNVPVWFYGVSVGSIVEGEMGDKGWLNFRRVLRDSLGGTLRFIVPPTGPKASEIYLTRVIADAKRFGLYIGPATFFNPRLVAVHVHERAKWWPEVGGYLDQLVREGLLQQWEVGDPNQSAADHDEERIEKVAPGGTALVHPLPIDGLEGQHVS
jgi:hypothetical protein